MDIFAVAPDRAGHRLTIDYREQATVVTIEEDGYVVIARARPVGSAWGVTLELLANGEARQPAPHTFYSDLPSRGAAQMVAIGLVASRVWEQADACDCGKGEYCPEYGWAFRNPPKEEG